MEIRFTCDQECVSGKSLAAKFDVPSEVLRWHLEKAIKNKVLTLGEDCNKIGRGYYLSLEAVLWTINELRINDFKTCAEVIREMLTTGDKKEELSKLKELVDQQSEILASMLDEPKEESSKMEEKPVELPFNKEQKAYWDEVQTILANVKKQTGHSSRRIMKSTCEQITKKYGIVWDQLKREVIREMDLSEEWAMDSRGFSNLQAIVYSDEQTRSIFKAVLFDYPKWCAAA